MYSGPFTTLAKAEFSNSGNAKVQKWSAYVKGSANRQDFLERALSWVCRGDVGGYMGRHRFDGSIHELKTTFDTVIDWVSSVFTDVEKEMSGLEWGRLYEAHHGTAYDPAKLSAEVRRLYADSYVKKRAGVFEYVLGGCQDARLLDVRVFDEGTKAAVYKRQTAEAEAAGTSNCPLCALGHDSNKRKIWALKEMDADHVASWSKGGWHGYGQLPDALRDAQPGEGESVGRSVSSDARGSCESRFQPLPLPPLQDEPL